MKVRTLTTDAGPEGIVPAGTIVVMADDQARAAIAARLVEPAEAAVRTAPETATAPAPERAIAGPANRRRR